MGAAGLLGFALLLSLRDSRPADVEEKYASIRLLFQDGYLEQSQAEAEQGYNRWALSDPQWGIKFRLVEAQAMLWRGMYSDSLRVLNEVTPPATNRELSIQKLTMEGVALTRMQKFAAADLKLSQAERFCGGADAAACGEVVRARGVAAMEVGKFGDAQRLFAQSLDFARRHHDAWLEATALLNLGAASIGQEHFDEAADWTGSANRAAAALNAKDLEQTSLGNLGWAYFKLGDHERALQSFLEARKRAAALGDVLYEIKWLIASGYVDMESGKFEAARQAYQTALQSARKINSKDDIETALVVLAQTSVAEGRPDEADAYAQHALEMARESGNPDDRIDILAIQVQTAALRGDKPHAEQLLREVEAAPESQTSMKWASERAMARLYEDRGEQGAALNAYRTALATFESARAEIRNEDSRLPFLTNATRIYDDYIHFLVKQGKTDEALRAADQSRARTLAQGLGLTAQRPEVRPAALCGTEIARKAGATILFYWLGEKESYLWAMTPARTSLFTLPAQSAITPLIERYRRALLAPNLAFASTSEEGLALYRILVAPAANLIPVNGTVAVVSDGPLSLLNFETLVVQGTETNANPHYWIEDANVISAPSLYLLAAARPTQPARGKLLLLGDAVSPNPDYPDLPMAAAEMSRVRRHFAPIEETVYSRQAATSGAYLESALKGYSYIHFVAHGVASRTDPLDSAIILSRTSRAEDSFKLHARDIIRRPIDARLVTISACYGGGTRSYAGEGLVGLSWAFLRAGAHNVIGALWEASDESTPQLMDGLYQGLEDGKAPSAALREAKLALVHSQGKFREPFYWAPFQIYTGL